jgi:hypothetical protein
MSPADLPTGAGDSDEKHRYAWKGNGGKGNGAMLWLFAYWEERRHEYQISKAWHCNPCNPDCNPVTLACNPGKYFRQKFSTTKRKFFIFRNEAVLKYRRNKDRLSPQSHFPQSRERSIPWISQTI